MDLLGIYAIPCIALFLLGLALMIVETFTPGFGVAGSLGVLCFIAIVILQFMGNTPSAAWLVTGILFIITISLWFWVVYSFQYGRLSRSKLVQTECVVENASPLEAEKAILHVGERGAAHTPLRPAGIAMFGERRENVTSDGEFIEAGAEVEISAIVGLNVTVKRAEQ